MLRSNFFPKLRRLVIYAVLAFGLLLLLGRVLSPISTLMLQRYVTLQSTHRAWVPLTRISPNLIRSVVVAEDAAFCDHHGVDWRALYQVIRHAGDNGPRRGASTISMQLARNLFLWQGRSYLRKALEIPLAITIEAAWPKRRILEVYLNIAEWGDGVFGIEAAAQKNFRHSAHYLSSREAALLAVMLPSPTKRSAGRPGPGVQNLAGDLAARVAIQGADISCIRK
jgi:monofunctional biosynthetic peptidoglycan transglycosylase